MNLRSCAALALALCAPSIAAAAIKLQRTYTSAIPGAEFGYACAVIGDMDGDGFHEFAIGAPGDDTGGADAGRVFIYRGGHPLPDEPTWVITGAPGSRLGHSLVAGDIDDDFIPDLVIGAPGTADQTGSVKIAYGGDPLGARPVRTVDGTAAGGRFGWSVATLTRWGSYPVRFVVGAPEANGAAGEVHALKNGDPPPAERAFVLNGASAGDRFGYAVSDAGVTRGFLAGVEFLVGAPEASVGAPSEGWFALYLQDDPNDMSPGVGFEASGTSAGERLGHSVTGGEDTNPNFFEPGAEFVAGAPGAYPIGPSGLGRANVRTDVIGDFDIQGSAAGAGLGSTVRLLGTVTGSWLADFAVSETGSVRVYAGPLHPSMPPAAILLAEQSGGRFGHAISNAGWIETGPGSHNQFLVSDPDFGGTGRVYLYGNPSPITDVGDPGAVARVELAPPAPNPASGTVSFSVGLPRAMAARIAVYDVAGREVARVHEGPLAPGTTRFEWDARRGSGPGLYFLALDTEIARVTRRLAVTR